MVVQPLDDMFDRAKDITPEVEEILERHLSQKPLTPYQFYQLCLHYLYPQLSQKSFRTLKNYDFGYCFVYTIGIN